MSNELIAAPQTGVTASEKTQLFELAQRKAKMYASSTLVPERYANNPANCMIALNIANRIGADELMVMQNLYVVHGNPGWSAQFLIAAFNGCGRFAPIRYELEGTPGKPGSSCTAISRDLATGEEIRGTKVTWEMVTAEKWNAKAGSKWLTMPEQMFRYRAAAFLVRTTAPEIAIGMQTKEELDDVIEGEIVASTRIGGRRPLASLAAKVVDAPQDTETPEQAFRRCLAEIGPMDAKAANEHIKTFDTGEWREEWGFELTAALEAKASK